IVFAAGRFLTRRGTSASSPAFAGSRACCLLSPPGSWRRRCCYDRFARSRRSAAVRQRGGESSIHRRHGCGSPRPRRPRNRRRLLANGFSPRFFDVPVVNEFFKAKVRRYLGLPGIAAIAVLNPDRLPIELRTNLYVVATKQPR